VLPSCSVELAEIQTIFAKFFFAGQVAGFDVFAARSAAFFAHDGAASITRKTSMEFRVFLG